MATKVAKSNLLRFPGFQDPERGETLRIRGAEVLNINEFRERMIGAGVELAKTALTARTVAAANNVAKQVEVHAAATMDEGDNYENERERLAREARVTTQSVHQVLTSLRQDASTSSDAEIIEFPLAPTSTSGDVA